MLLPVWRRRGQVRRAATLPAAATLLAAATLVTPAELRSQVTATVHVTVRAAPAAAMADHGARAAASIPVAGATIPVAGATIPVAGAAVTVMGTGLTVLTGPGGGALLRGLSPGRHALTISALGFAEATVEVEAANGRLTRASVVLDPAPVRLAGLDVRVASREGAGRATIVDASSLPPGVADLAAALDRVPGATVVRQGGPGASAVVQLRGSGGDQVLVLLDGTPINSPLTGEADLGTVELEGLARIVVIPGAQSARYGARALGGVVLLESREAGSAGATFTAGTGSWSSAETAASVSRPLGRAWSAAAAARWRHSGGAFTYDVPAFRGGGETTRENAAFTQAGGDVRVTQRGGLNTSLRAHVSDAERGNPGTIAQPSLTGRQHHRRWGVSARIQPGDSGLGGTVRTAVQWQRARFADPAPPFGRPYDTRTRVRRAELALEGWWRRGAPSLRAGLHAARLDIASDALASSRVSPGEFGAWARAGRSWNPGHGVRLDLGAAVRADRHDLVAGTTLSPTVDVILNRAGLTLDLRWGRGFSPPGLGDLFFREGVLVEPNPDLGPERIRGELAVSMSHAWSLGRAAGQVRGTAYRADLDDMILWFPDHRFVWSPDNYDVMRRGLEARCNRRAGHGRVGHGRAGAFRHRERRLVGGRVHRTRARRPGRVPPPLHRGPLARDCAPRRRHPGARGHTCGRTAHRARIGVERARGLHPAGRRDRHSRGVRKGIRAARPRREQHPRRAGRAPRRLPPAGPWLVDPTAPRSRAMNVASPHHSAKHPHPH